MNKTLITRIILCVLGVFLCGTAVGFFRFASFGVDPFTTTVCGFDFLIPLSYGTVYVIINALLLLFALIFDRHYIGLGTVINLFLVGYTADFTQKILSEVLPFNLVARVICLIIGVLALSFSAALYMPADLGVSTYDAVALIIANTWRKGSFRLDRVITDLICVLIGSSLCLISGQSIKDLLAIVGVGTIITAFFMGPLITFMSDRFTRRFILKD